MSVCEALEAGALHLAIVGGRDGHDHAGFFWKRAGRNGHGLIPTSATMAALRWHLPANRAERFSPLTRVNRLGEEAIARNGNGRFTAA